MRYNDWLSDKIRTKFQGNGHKKAIHVDVQGPKATDCRLEVRWCGAQRLDTLVAAQRSETDGCGARLPNPVGKVRGAPPLLPGADVVQARLREELGYPRARGDAVDARVGV